MKMSFYEWCIQNNRNDLLDRWDYDLNNVIPSEILHSSNKSYYFKCDTNPKHRSSKITDRKSVV